MSLAHPAPALELAAPGELAAGRVGPNAVIRLAEALDASHGPAVTARVFVAAGQEDRLANPPAAMVDERDVARLYAALWRTLPSARAHAVAREAGRRTADYLLAHRIPPAARAALPWLPGGLAARLLVRAIAGNAWTFAGSGRFHARATRHGVDITIAPCPLALAIRTGHPACGAYAATFERLFQALVWRGAVGRETACAAKGDPTCAFRVVPGGPPPSHPFTLG